MYAETSMNDPNPDLDDPNDIANRSSNKTPSRSVTELTTETVGALHDNQEFFPSGILSVFGINEGVISGSLGGEQIDVEGGNMTTSYDVPDETTKMKRETKLRYSWIFIFYFLFPLGDLISDVIITGIVSK